MKRLSPKTISLALAGEILLAKARLARTEDALATAQEQVEAARERRKAARLALRRAKKRCRAMKDKAARAKLFLVRLEQQASQLTPPSQARRPGKPAAARPLRKTPAPAKNISPARPARRTSAQIARKVSQLFEGEIPAAADPENIFTDTKAAHTGAKPVSPPNPQEIT
jgi:hypothetical protein